MEANRNLKLKGYILACVSAISYGTIPLFAVPLMRQGMDFDTVLFYRFAITSLLVGIYLAARGVKLGVNLRQLGVLAILGVVYALSSEFLFLSYRYMPVSIASTILFTYPLFVALLMAVFFREKIKWPVWLAIALAFTGIMFLNRGKGSWEQASAAGLGIAIASALAYALYMVIVNKSAVRDMPGPKVTLYSMAFCALFFLVKSFTHSGLQAIPTCTAGIEVALFAIVSTAVSCVTLVMAIQYIGSAPTSVMGALEPIVAVAVSVMVFGEAFTANMGVGITLTIIAVLVVILADYVNMSRQKPAGKTKSPKR